MAFWSAILALQISAAPTDPLRENVPNPDPAMITPEGSLQLTKESVQPMLYWMRLWRATVDKSAR